MLTRLSTLLILSPFALLGGSVVGSGLQDDVASHPSDTHSKAVLLLQSGFEQGTTIVGRLLVGRDATRPKSDWSVDAGGIAKAIAINLGTATHGETAADIVPDPVDPSNQTLRLTLRNFSQEQGQQKARAQLDLYAIKEGLREFTYSTDMYIPESFNVLQTYPVKINWLTIAEFWNNEFWENAGRYGFRVTVGIGKAAGTHPLNFFLNAGLTNQTTIWEQNDPTALVPISKWFRIDYYFLEGGQNTGRFVMYLTPRGEARRKIYDVTNYTRHPDDPAPDGLTGFNPIKLYTSRGPTDYARKYNTDLEVYWDNFRLYRGNAIAAVPSRGGNSKRHRGIAVAHP